MNPLASGDSPRNPSRLALAGLALAVLLSTLNTSIVNVALPVLAQVFAASTQVVQWTVISFVLAITALIVSVGRLADIEGRKRLLLAGLGLFIAAAAACAMAPNLGWLIGARFLQGIGAAVMMAISVALLGDLTGKENAGRAMGVLGSMSAIGTALGPALGGVLIAAFGWRAIFLLSVPLGLIAFALVWRSLPADRVAPGGAPRDFDALGTLLLAASLTAYALAMTRGRAGFGGANVALLAVAVGGLGLFIRVQRRAASPLLRLELLRAPELRSGLAMSLLVAAVMMTTLVVGPFYLAQVLHVSAGAMGMVLSVGPLAAAVVAAPAGRMVDRVGTGRVTVVGLGGAALGCLGLVLLPENFGVAGYVVAVAVMTSGYSLFQTANNTAVMQGAAAEQRGVISGVLNLSRNLGLVTGASLLGAVFAWALGNAMAPDAAAVARATQVTFGVATAFIGAALVLGVRALHRGAEQSCAKNISPAVPIGDRITATTNAR